MTPFGEVMLLLGASRRTPGQGIMARSFATGARFDNVLILQGIALLSASGLISRLAPAWEATRLWYRLDTIRVKPGGVIPFKAAASTFP